MFSKKLRRLRKKHKFTQAELGHYLKISASTIGMYEQGRRKPDSSTIIKICKFFHVTIDYLMKDFVSINDGKIKKESQLNDIIEDFRNFLLEQKCLMFDEVRLECGDIENIIFAIKIAVRLIIEQKK